MGLRTWIVRRAMGRLQAPGDMLTVDAKTVVRSVRTATASQLGVDWVWPHWLELQSDPGSPAFVPRGPLPVSANVTRRNWTMLGNVASLARPIVDPCGLVTPWLDGWSLDWWIGAEDRWHFPSREVAVRQHLIGGAPVVETSVRVPSGDAVQRAYAVSATPSANDTTGELLVVEFENRSPVPFVLALALRPYNPEGLAAIHTAELHDSRVVTVDGRTALLLPRPPSAVAGSNFAAGDVAGLVTAHATAPVDQFAPIFCKAGMAQMALVYPLPHRAVLQVALPLEPTRQSHRRAVVRRRAPDTLAFPLTLPTAETVARGWQSIARRGMRLELPAGRLANAVEANRKFLLLFHAGRDVLPGPFTDHAFSFREATYLLGALDHYGFHDEAAEVLRTYPTRQKFDGVYSSQREEGDANGCAIHAVAQHWRLTRDDTLLTALVPSVALGARWIRRRLTGGRGGPGLDGLMPVGVSAPHLGGRDCYYWDNFWSVAGLRDGAELLAAAGNDHGAALCLEWAASLFADVQGSLTSVAAALGTAAIPAGPRRRVDAAAVASLVACEPLHLLTPGDPAIVATLQAVRDRFCRGPAVYDPIGQTGLSPALTLQVAAVEARQGDRTALERLQWLVDSSTDTFTWPGAIHPRLGGGCMGDGHDGWAAAEFLNLVRTMLVREADLGLASADGEHSVALELCSMLPDAWEGQPVEVHDAPTAVGRVSFVVRWHGNRPALLWELIPHDGVGPVRVSAPGLDQTWSSHERRGEALLSGSLSGVAGGAEASRGER